MLGTHVIPVLALVMLALLPLLILLQLFLKAIIFPFLIRTIHQLVPLLGGLIGFPLRQQLLSKE